jgi:aldose 1-epimerase
MICLYQMAARVKTAGGNVDRNFARELADGREQLISIDDGMATVELAPGTGGAVASYRWGKDGRAVDWLRPADPKAIDNRDAGAMACFPLVPYSNRIRGGRFTFAGRTVTLPATPDDPNYEHGHGWRRKWSLVEHREAAAVLRYRHAADAWPWSYEAKQAIALERGCLVIRISVRNLSTEPMPTGFGAASLFSRDAVDACPGRCHGHVGNRRRGPAHPPRPAAGGRQPGDGL